MSTSTDVWHPRDDRPVISLLTEGLQKSVIKAHAARPELFGISEDEFLALGDVGKLGMGPTPNSLRAKFWLEYDEAQAENRHMRANHIFAGICDAAYFYTKFMADPMKVAWMMTRPKSYADATEEMHLYALRKMRALLEQDAVVKGKFDPKIGELQLKIFLALDMRVKGAVVQKTMNVHATLAKVDGRKRETLEQRLKALEQLSDQQQGKIVDTKPVDAE